MRTLHLARQFDVVLIHDAIMYATDAASVRGTLETAAVHCRAGGTVVVLPDYVSETFRPGTEEGGHDASDGRGLRYLEWCWDPDPNDDTYIVDYAFLLRDVTGEVRVVHDRHEEGLFPRARWFEWFEGAGLSAQSDRDTNALKFVFLANSCERVSVTFVPALVQRHSAACLVAAMPRCDQWGRDVFVAKPVKSNAFR